MEGIVRALFPAHPVRVDGNSMEGAEYCPLFSMKDSEEAILPTKKKNAPRVDGIPAEVNKIISTRPTARLNQRLHERGTFLSRWKVTKRSLISKRQWDLELPSA